MTGSRPCIAKGQRAEDRKVTGALRRGLRVWIASSLRASLLTGLGARHVAPCNNG